MSNPDYESCLRSCTECARACEFCASACLAERDTSHLAECISLDMDCALACWGAAALLSRGSHFSYEFCLLCAEICEGCAAECAKHPMNHCQRCARKCAVCAEECRQLAGARAA